MPQGVGGGQYANPPVQPLVGALMWYDGRQWAGTPGISSFDGNALVLQGSLQTLNGVIQAGSTSGNATIICAAPTGSNARYQFISGPTQYYQFAGGAGSLACADSANGYNIWLYTPGAASASTWQFNGTLSATTSLVGAVVIGNGTAATSAAFGAGNAQIGAALTVGGNGTVGNSAAGATTFTVNAATATIPAISLGINGVSRSAMQATSTIIPWAVTDPQNGPWTPIAYVAGASTAGYMLFSGTLDASSSTVAANVMSGGLAVKKNAISAQGLGWGVTSTATAAGTTVLTTSTAVCQVFTGVTTQSVTLPAANAFGAGVAYVLRIKNVSTGTVTINRAGADTIDGGTSTTLTGGSKQSVDLISDGVSAWYIT